MSSPCLSSVLTHANHTMYQTPYSTNVTGQWYGQISPHCWTADNVLEWISDQVESTKFDANTLSLAYCTMDGHTLCQMNWDQMTGVFGKELGTLLHQSLQEHKTKYGTTAAVMYTAICVSVKNIYFCEFLKIFLSLSFSQELQSLSGPELHETCQLLDNFLDNLNFPLLSTIRIGQAPRGTHLWEFIRDILIHPEKNQGLMKWEDRREGVFKFLKSEAVAQMWGQKKRNSSMTYEKLSRAMRYYYKRDILERVDGRRLVYKFGKNSSGWKIEEIGMAM
uniref:E74-like factor 3 (ets domain transcription factor, epithelial-specific ) n=1 Tax=Mastacembelus armatus TaxID=205130 RepID=A0A7N9AMM5_9TELE